MKRGARGATLIELMVTVAVIAIISAVTSGIIISLIQLLIYLPREARTIDAANDIVTSMMEGTSDMRGMRYAVSVVDASTTQFTYIFGYPTAADQRRVRFRWDGAGNRVLRSVSAYGGSVFGAEAVIPYYAAGNISVTRPSGSSGIFTYYGAGNSAWAGPVSNIRRVDISMIVVTGSGAIEGWEGSFTASTGIDIKQYP